MTTNCSVHDSPVLQNCDCELPLFLCAFANVCGYCSTVLWFVVLVPQVVRNFRKRTVEGQSAAWAIANFTAALNNAFFVFKAGSMPWFVYGSAVYMPLLEGLMLAQFVAFTPRSSTKLGVCAVCLLAWAAIVVAQVFFDVYRQFEWLSIFLWSAETFPQIFLNMRRQSTHGLSNPSIAIASIGKTTDFVQNYVLIMPLQYVVMAFFSSSVAQIGTIQVLWYWNQRPDEQQSGKLLQEPITPTCHLLRVVGMSVLGAELLVFIAALLLRTRIWWLFGAPVLVYGLVLAFFVWTRLRCEFPWTRADTVEQASPEETEESAQLPADL
ncbi:hypothetical protein M3Y99_01953400 [Aphelenchoides fujianensis]|nr:hypothetical protein M3Y99_01953400 [Aphelenchoides fujianensis]